MNEYNVGSDLSLILEDKGGEITSSNPILVVLRSRNRNTPIPLDRGGDLVTGILDAFGKHGFALAGEGVFLNGDEIRISIIPGKDAPPKTKAGAEAAINQFLADTATIRPSQHPGEGADWRGRVTDTPDERFAAFARKLLADHGVPNDLAASLAAQLLNAVRQKPDKSI